MTADPKPAKTSLQQGLPPEKHNGLFGAENKIMHLGVGGRFTAVTLMEVADIITSEADGTIRPVVKFVAIEPTWDEDDDAAAKGVHESSYKARTSANQLDFSEIGVAPTAAEKKDAKKAKADATVTPIGGAK